MQPGSQAPGNPDPFAIVGSMGTKINVEELFQGMVIQGASAPKQAPTPPQSTGSALDSDYPLHDACARGYLDKVKWYVENRHVDVNQRGQPPQKWCPLHCTAFSEFKSLEVARYLLESGANPSAQDEDGWTALHFASTKGHTDLVELLLQAKADHAIKDNDGFTALHEAARSDHKEVVRLLLDAGASVDVRVVNALELRGLFKVPRVFAAAIQIGRSPLHWAAANGHVEVVERLCEAKADVASLDSNFDTPLFMAAGNGKVDVMETLIRFGADALAAHQSGFNLLHHAAANGQPQVIHTLVRNIKLPISGVDMAQHTALHLAVLREQFGVVKTLLELGAAVDAPGPLMYTPLHYACRWNLQEIGSLLIENKANLDAPDEDGWTPLHWACSSDALSCLAILVLSGAMQTIRDKLGLMPVDVASASAREVLFQSITMKQRQQASVLHPPHVLSALSTTLPLAPYMAPPGAGLGVGFGVGAGGGEMAADGEDPAQVANVGGAGGMTQVGVLGFEGRVGGQVRGHAHASEFFPGALEFPHTPQHQQQLQQQASRGAPHMLAMLGGGMFPQSSVIGVAEIAASADGMGLAPASNGSAFTGQLAHELPVAARHSAAKHALGGMQGAAHSLPGVAGLPGMAPMSQPSGPPHAMPLAAGAPVGYPLAAASAHVGMSMMQQ